MTDPSTASTPSVSDLTVVLTGAASGIGAATLRLLHAGGANGINLDRHPLSADDAALPHRHIICDLTDRNAIDHAVGEIGHDVDALCNVAGVPGTADPVSVLSVNFLALRHLTESLAGSINNGGSIVNVASVAGSQWMENLSDVRRLIATANFDDGRAWAGDQPIDGARAYNFSKEAVLVWSMPPPPMRVAVSQQIVARRVQRVVRHVPVNGAKARRPVGQQPSPPGRR